MSEKFSADQIAERVSHIVDERTALEGPLLPILHAVQEELGHVPETALRTIADKLNLSRAEVHGVASFYHDFRENPAGRHTIKVCRAEACQAMNGERLAAELRAALKLDWNDTTADGSVTLEPVYCLGLCACAPALLVDGRPVGRLNHERLDTIVSEVRA